jgi:hypothetical protein
MRLIKTKQPIMSLLRFLAGGVKAAAGIGGMGGGATIVDAGGVAATVGAMICFPQLRQKLSLGISGVPQWGQTVAFRVGSLIIPLEFSTNASGSASRCRASDSKMHVFGDASIEKENESQ